jgi:tetratricopeptide (TPR) repeat protein
VPRNYRLSNRTAIIISLFVALSIVGCSNYTPNSSIVAKDKLAEYNPKHFSNKEISSSSKKHLKNEGELIMRAIWHEQQGDFKRSNAIYNKLYNETNNEEYLLKESMTALYIGKKSKNISKLKAYAKEKPNDIKVQRVLLSSLLNEKRYEEAKVVAKELISKSTQPIDYELAANPYIYTADYKEATKLLSEAYSKTYNEDILIKISTLLANYMKDVPAAIIRLEGHRVTKGCGEKICLQLLDIYAQQNDIDKVVSVYESLYSETKEEAYAEKLIDAYIYKKDYPKAINFLKNKYNNKELLYALYIEKKDYLKAVELSKILLNETKNPKWNAEAAMALFESSSDKNNKVMLQEVVNLFEKALSKGVENSVYLNYYGYTLIDKEIDVPKGIMIIKKALKMEPENTYYLDSLAWGYYRLNECDEAYSTMKKVIDIEGLKEQELIEHWDAISRKCKR